MPMIPMIAGGGGGKVDVTVTPWPDIQTLQTPLALSGKSHHVVSIGDGSVIAIQNMYANGAEIAGNRYYIDGRYEKVQLMTPGQNYTAESTVCPLGDGRYIIAGGAKDTGYVPIATVTCYDKNNVRVAFPSLSQARRAPCGVMDGLGRAILAGGNIASSDYNRTMSAVVDRIDANGVLTVLPSLPTATLFARGARFGDGSVGFFGGFLVTSTTRSKAVVRYDTSGNMTTLPDMATVRASHAVVSLNDGRVLVAGGNNGTTDLNTVECYDASGNKTAFPNLPTAYPYIGVTDGQGRAVFVGGKKVYRYSSNGTLETLPDLPAVLTSGEQQSQSAGVFGDGSIFLIDTKYSGNPPVYRINGGSKSITIPACNAYRFSEHASEQAPFTQDMQINVATPNTGYFKQKKGSITL